VGPTLTGRFVAPWQANLGPAQPNLGLVQAKLGLAQPKFRSLAPFFEKGLDIFSQICNPLYSFRQKIEPSEQWRKRQISLLLSQPVTTKFYIKKENNYHENQKKQQKTGFKQKYRC
jgi:hypothetical protein